MDCSWQGLLLLDAISKVKGMGEQNNNTITHHLPTWPSNSNYWNDNDTK